MFRGFVLTRYKKYLKYYFMLLLILILHISKHLFKPTAVTVRFQKVLFVFLVGSMDSLQHERNFNCENCFIIHNHHIFIYSSDSFSQIFKNFAHVFSYCMDIFGYKSYKFGILNSVYRTDEVPNRNFKRGCLRLCWVHR